MGIYQGGGIVLGSVVVCLVGMWLRRLVGGSTLFWQYRSLQLRSCFSIMLFFRCIGTGLVLTEDGHSLTACCTYLVVGFESETSNPIGEACFLSFT